MDIARKLAQLDEHRVRPHVSEIAVNIPGQVVKDTVPDPP